MHCLLLFDTYNDVSLKGAMYFLVAPERHIFRPPHISRSNFDQESVHVMTTVTRLPLRFGDQAKNAPVSPSLSPDQAIILDSCFQKLIELDIGLYSEICS